MTLADVRPLDLDRHDAAAGERRLVHLGQGGGGDGDVVERRESLVEPHAQLGAHDLLDFFVGERGDMVLKARERLEVGQGQEVGAGGEELAQLHERGTELLEVLRQLRGVVYGSRRGLRLVGERVVDGQRFRQVGTAVLEQQRRDLLVALQVLGLERESHGAFQVNRRRFRSRDGRSAALSAAGERARARPPVSGWSSCAPSASRASPPPWRSS